MKNARIILFGLFLLSSFGYSIQNKDIVGSWSVSKDHEQWSNYPDILFDSSGIATLYSRDNIVKSGRYCIDKDDLSIDLGGDKERLKIISHSNGILVLTGFSHNLVQGEYKPNDTVTYLYVRSDIDYIKYNNEK